MPSSTAQECPPAKPGRSAGARGVDLEGDAALGNTRGGIVVDDKGTVYFNTDAEHAIVVVGADGAMRATVGAGFAGGAHGRYIAGEGDGQVLYVAHTGLHAVLKLSLNSGDAGLRLRTRTTEPLGH